ncbi:MAG: hypothetical protein RLZZ157_1913 [Pseudomonadota bacterium]|jgi:hypothetical protein
MRVTTTAPAIKIKGKRTPERAARAAHILYQRWPLLHGAQLVLRAPLFSLNVFILAAWQRTSSF